MPNIICWKVGKVEVVSAVLRTEEEAVTVESDVEDLLLFMSLNRVAVMVFTNESCKEVEEQVVDVSERGLRM